MNKKNNCDSSRFVSPEKMPRRRVNRTSISSIPSTYSSTDSDTESKQKKPIRRRKRKQKGSKEDTSLVKKSSEIEDALLIRDGDKLAQLAVSPLGLLSDEVTFVMFKVKKFCGPGSVWVHLISASRNRMANKNTTNTKITKL